LLDLLIGDQHRSAQVPQMLARARLPQREFPRQFSDRHRPPGQRAQELEPNLSAEYLHQFRNVPADSPWMVAFILFVVLEHGRASPPPMHDHEGAYIGSTLTSFPIVLMPPCRRWTRPWHLFQR